MQNRSRSPSHCAIDREEAASDGAMGDRNANPARKMSRSLVRQRVEDVCHGHDPTHQGNRLSGQTQRIPGAIPAFVVGE